MLINITGLYKIQRIINNYAKQVWFKKHNNLTNIYPG